MQDKMASSPYESFGGGAEDCKLLNKSNVLSSSTMNQILLLLHTVATHTQTHTHNNQTKKKCKIHLIISLLEVWGERESKREQDFNVLAHTIAEADKSKIGGAH